MYTNAHLLWGRNAIFFLNKNAINLGLYGVFILLTFYFTSLCYGQTWIQIGTGTLTSSGSTENPFDAESSKTRTNYVITKADLNASGAEEPGTFYRMGIYCIPSVINPEFYSPNLNLLEFTIRLKHINTTTINGFDETGTEVYFNSSLAGTTLNGEGWKDFVFDTPFHWNGDDNILVEICFASSQNPVFQGQVYVINKPDAVWQRRANIADDACELSGGSQAGRIPHTRFYYEEVNIPLPVDLTDFSVICKNGISSLHWETASESNSDYFSVQKSHDGSNWSEIGTVKAQGNTSHTTSYSLIDEEYSRNDIVYYRLHQFDFDGENELFGPISSHCKRFENTAYVVPNPTEDYAEIIVQWSSEKTSATYTLTDAYGRQIAQQTTRLDPGSNILTLELNRIPKGLYFVHFETLHENIESVKFVKK